MSRSQAYWHDEASWKGIWREMAQEAGCEVDVWVEFEQAGLRDGQGTMMDENARRLKYAVRIV